MKRKLLQLTKTILPVILVLINLGLHSQTITTICGSVTTGYSGDNGLATAAEISADAGQLAADASGNIYIADYSNQRIRKINISTGTITTIAGIGTASSTGDGGAATLAELNDPYGVAVDNLGNVYISEYSGNRIRKIATNGTITTICGNGTPSSTGDGGLATAATINRPGHICVDAAGNIYFAEYSGNIIRKIATTGTITTLAGTGVAANTGNGGLAAAAEISAPWAIGCDASGNVYTAAYSTSSSGAQVRKIATNGTITAFAGTGVAGFSGDNGPANAATVEDIQGIAVNAAGYVIINDDGNYRVRAISPGGTITTIAGTGTNGYTGDGGISTAAEVESTTGVIAFGCNLYFIDGSGARIRKISKPITVNAVTSNTLICVGQSATLTASGATSYSWNTSSSNTVIVVSPTVTTTYTVNGNNGYCIGSKTITQSVSTCASVSEFGVQSSEIGVFPNPTSGSFVIEYPPLADWGGIEVFNLLGDKIYTAEIVSDKTSIDLTNQANGIYFIRITSNNNSVTKKIIKE